MREIHRNIVGVVVISKEGKIFLVRSSPTYKGSYEGFWVIPGGGIEEGETALQAVIRETREETGIDISQYQINLVNDTRTGKSEKTLKTTGERVLVKMNFSEFTVVISDSLTSDMTVTLSPEHSEYKWFDKEDLKEVTMSPPTLGLFKQLGYI